MKTVSFSQFNDMIKAKAKEKGITIGTVKCTCDCSDSDLEAARRILTVANKL